MDHYFEKNNCVNKQLELHGHDFLQYTYYNLKAIQHNT